MPVTVWLRILGGDLVETVKDVKADTEADYVAQNVGARVGAGVDWTAAGKRAGAVAGESMGGVLKMGGPVAIMMVADWFLAGAVELLGTEAGKPAADAIAKLGDALLEVLAKVVRPLVPFVLKVITTAEPVVSAIVDITLWLGTSLVAAIGLVADVLKLAARLGSRLKAGLVGIGRDLGAAWAVIHNGLRAITRTIDGLVAGVADGVANLLTYILDSLLGPLREHMDNLSRLWDEWIARHLDDLLGGPAAHPRSEEGYWLNGVFYPWGTAPPGMPGSHGRVVEHPASEAQLVAAIGDYARANGGLARALWAPA